MSRFRGPVRTTGDGYVIALDPDEAALVRRLAAELRDLLTSGDDHDLLGRLFPAAYTDDDEREAEYQRLMREELVASKLAALRIVDDALAERAEPIDESGLVAVMQAINSVRLVLGTMLGVTDDPAVDEVPAEHEASPEYALYGYLSWLLDHCVRALTRR